MWYCRKNSRVTLNNGDAVRILLTLVIAMMVVAVAPRAEAFGAQPAQIVVAQSNGKLMNPIFDFNVDDKPEHLLLIQLRLWHTEHLLRKYYLLVELVTSSSLHSQICCLTAVFW